MFGGFLSPSYLRYMEIKEHPQEIASKSQCQLQLMGLMFHTEFADGDVNRFPDGDGNGDRDEAEKQGWGWCRRNLCSPESLIAGIFARRNYWLTEIFGHSLAGIYVEPAALPESSMVLLKNFLNHKLYVALSRGIPRATTKVLVKPEKEFGQEGVYTSNVVYQEVLRDE
ncbi:hypothetical protein Tco_0712897 [Tanacetum coccineum]